MSIGTSCDFHRFSSLLRRRCSPPAWRSSPTRAAPCSTRPPPGDADASLSGGRGTGSAAARGRDGHQTSPGTACLPPALKPVARPSCTARCSSGDLGRSGYKGRTSAGTRAGHTSRIAAHSPTTVRAADWPRARLCATRPSASPPACIHPGALAKRAAQCLLDGSLHFYGRARAAYSFPTRYPQESQLPRTPSTAQVRAQCSSHRGATSGDYGDEKFDIDIDASDNVTPRNLRIAATTHT